MRSIYVTASDLRPGDNLWISADSGVRAHRIAQTGTVEVWSEPDPRVDQDRERLIASYSASEQVRLHCRATAPLGRPAVSA